MTPEERAVARFAYTSPEDDERLLSKMADPGIVDDDEPDEAVLGSELCARVDDDGVAILEVARQALMAANYHQEADAIAQIQGNLRDRERAADLEMAAYAANAEALFRPGTPLPDMAAAEEEGSIAYPSLTVGGMTVFVYAKDGEARVSIDFEEMDLCENIPYRLYGEDSCVPLEISVNGQTVASFSEGGNT
jgi:hypothetical protein